MWRVSVAEKLADSVALGPKFRHACMARRWGPSLGMHAWQVLADSVALGPKFRHACMAVWNNDDSAMNSVPISYICACTCASGVP